MMNVFMSEYWIWILVAWLFGVALIYVGAIFFNIDILSREKNKHENEVIWLWPFTAVVLVMLGIFYATRVYLIRLSKWRRPDGERENTEK